MNKKVVVMMVLAGVQNAHASWFEILSKIPGMGKLFSTIVVVSQGKRKSILPATPALTVPYTPSEKAEKLIKKEFVQQIHEATNAHGLKISANIAGNVTIETHDQANITVNATAKGLLEEKLDNVTYKLERDPDNTDVFLLNSYDNNQSSKSVFHYLLFWKQSQKPSLNSLNFSIKIPKYFNRLTNDSVVEGDFTLYSHGLTEAACICALKGRGGKILVNNFTGTLDAETTNGSIITNNNIGLLELKTNNGDITVNKWSINNPRSVVNNISSDAGNIKIELPNNITITPQKSTNVIYEKRRYNSTSIMPFTKGSGLHQLTVSTPGNITLD